MKRLAPLACVLLALLAGVLAGCASSSGWKSSRKSGPMLNNKQHGLWTYYYENGNPQAQGSYDQDRQAGRWIYSYADGTKEWEVGFLAEQFEGPSRWTWPSGKPHAYGVFSSGLEAGLFTYWGEDGTLSAQGEFDDGRTSGGWASWNEDGSPRARGLQWKGQRVGTWEFFSSNGTAYVHEFPMPAGLKTHREEWPDGTPRREGFIEGGKPAGRWSTRHENGVRRASGRIQEGRPEGHWSFYRPDGTLLASAVFARGRPSLGLQAYDGLSPRTLPSSSIKIRDDVTGVSSAAESEGRPVGDVVSTWLSEALAPLAGNVEYRPEPAPEPPAELLAELGRKPVLPLRAQPWTVSEEANMDFLVKLYTDGAESSSAPMGGGRYGSRGRGGAKKVSEGDTEHSAPLVGTKLGYAKVLTRDGATLDLHSKEGKPLVLVILRGMAGEICVYCYTQVRALSNTMPEFKAAGADLVVVYPGDADRLETFWQELRRSEEFEGIEAPFTFAYDPGFDLVKALDIGGKEALPTTLVLDAGGTIRFAHVGTDSADRPDARRVLEQVKALESP